MKILNKIKLHYEAVLNKIDMKTNYQSSGEKGYNGSESTCIRKCSVVDKLVFCNINGFMKLLIVTFSLATMCIELRAQISKSDSANLRISYIFTQNNPSNLSLLRADTMALDIGETLSKFYDVTVEIKDSLRDAVLNPSEIKGLSIIKDTEAVDNMLSEFVIGKRNIYSPNDHIPFITFKDRSENQIHTLNQMSGFLGYSVYLSEKQVSQEWIIDVDTCRILDYVCFKATTKFRGREYVAYFTPDIPINEGPWKLYGLPGLILQAKTTDGLFSFHAIGIEKIKVKPIKVSYGANTEISKSLNQYQQFIRNITQKETYIFENNGQITIGEKRSSYDIEQLEVDDI